MVRHCTSGIFAFFGIDNKRFTTSKSFTTHKDGFLASGLRPVTHGVCLFSVLLFIHRSLLGRGLERELDKEDGQFGGLRVGLIEGNGNVDAHKKQRPCI
jgi:hypothetical protein